MHLFLVWGALACVVSAQESNWSGEVVVLERHTDHVDLMQSSITSNLRVSWTDDPIKVAVFWVAICFDLFWVTYKVTLASFNMQGSSGCDVMATIVWYALTVLVLGWVFPKDSTEKEVAEAVNSATQQITSIGYGSSGGTTSHERLFHGLNAVASQLGPSSTLGTAYELIRDSLTKTIQMLGGPKDTEKFPDESKKSERMAGTILLIVASLAAWTLFATDGYNGIDPWYTTLISATTIGYGDQGPQSIDHKWMSAFILPLLTNAFAGWSNPDEVKGSIDKASFGSDCGVDVDAVKQKLLKN